MALPDEPLTFVPTPGYSGIINNIGFLITNPCGATPWIYLETLIPVTGHALVEFLSFGLSDILIGYAHPKPRRGMNRYDRRDKAKRERGRDGKMRRARKFEIPEIGNEIGKHLPGSRYVKSVQTDLLSHLIWVPVDIAERAAWWWLITDILQDGVYNWASEIFKESCLGGSGGYAIQERQGNVGVFPTQIVKEGTYGYGASAGIQSASAVGTKNQSIAVHLSYSLTIHPYILDQYATVTMTLYGTPKSGGGSRVIAQHTKTTTVKNGDKPKPMTDSLSYSANEWQSIAIVASVDAVVFSSTSHSISWASVTEGR